MYGELIVVPVEQFKQLLKDTIGEMLGVSAGESTPKAPEVNVKAATPLVIDPVEVSTDVARRILAEKGYQVKSYAGLRKVMSENDIEGKKRGKVIYWPTNLVQKIPNIK